jgi:hypothetical protein
VGRNLVYISLGRSPVAFGAEELMAAMCADPLRSAATAVDWRAVGMAGPVLPCQFFHHFRLLTGQGLRQFILHWGAVTDLGTKNKVPSSMGANFARPGPEFR